MSRFVGKFLFLKTSSHKVLTEICVLYTLKKEKFSLHKVLTLKRILYTLERAKNTLSISTHRKVRFEGVLKL